MKMIKKPINLAANQSMAKTLLANVDHILCDCDGVLWLDNKPVQGAKEAIKALRALGKSIIFATNNSTKSTQDMVNKLNKMGFETNNHEIMVTSNAAAIYLKNQSNFTGSAYVVGSKGLKTELSLAGVPFKGHEDKFEFSDSQQLLPNVVLDDGIGAVIVTFDNEICLKKLIKISTYARKVPDNLFIATNNDATFPCETPELLIPGTGCFVSFVETAVARKAIILGKPSTFFFDCIKAAHPTIDPSRTLMIGDRLDSDIAFGHNNNFGYSLLVLTGVTNIEELDKYVSSDKEEDKILIPTHYIQSLGDLTKYI